MTRTSVNRRGASVAAAVILAGVLAGVLLQAAPVRAQGAETDARWTPWLGCWAPTAVQPDGAAAVGAGAAQMMCVIPAAGASGVDVVTLIAGKVTDRTRIDATGERRESVREGCTGWESAEWSADGRRVYRSAEYTCAAGVQHRSSGVMSMTTAGEWLDVQGVASGGAGGVRALRYHGVGDPGNIEIRAEVARAVQGRGLALSTARLAAAAPITTADVAEASRQLDAPVVEAWLVERGQGFKLDAKQLAALADAEVPSGVIDLMVALSYPKAFSIDLATRESELRQVSPTRTAESVAPIVPGMMVPVGLDWYPFGYYGWNAYSPYGYRYSPYGYGSGYGYGWYRGDQPVIVVVRQQPSSEPEQKHGKLVKGRGYTNGSNGNGGAEPRTRTNAGQSSTSQSGSQSSGGAAGSSGASSAGASSSGGTSTGRTAKPRDP